MNSSNPLCNHDPTEALFACSCAKLLCNRCKSSHERQHINQKDRYTISDIHQARNEVIQQVQQSIQALDNQQMSIGGYKQEIYESRQFKEGFELIHKAENEIKKLINAFFKVLEKDFAERCRLAKEDYEHNLDQAEKKLSYTLEAFQDISQGINNTKKPGLWQKTLEVALGFDFSGEVRRIHQEVEDSLKEKFFMGVNPKFLDPILEQLHNYIQITNSEVRPGESSTSNNQILSDMRTLEFNVAASYAQKEEKKAAAANNRSFRSGNNYSGMGIDEVTVSGSAGLSGKPDSVYDIKEFQVKMKNFFHPNSPNKVLHFFESNSRNLYLIPIQDIEAGNPQCHKIELNIKTLVPLRHRSVITPIGDIFLTGGSRGEEQLAYTYKLNYLNGALLPKRLMAYTRKSHGFCYLDGYLYALGGYNDEFGSLAYCERYDIAHDKWTPIASMNNASSSPSICTFRNQYIFKFGGLTGVAAVAEQIEKYDVKTDKWSVYQVRNTQEELGKLDFKIYWLSASCQINDNNILVFGGCDENNTGTKQCFLFEVNETDELGGGTMCNIRKRNTLALPYAAGFWSGQCIVENGKMYALQNDLMEHDSAQAHEDSRNLLIFDSNSWKIFKV